MPPLRKRVKRFLRYLLLSAAAAILASVPLARLRAMGRAFGSLVFALAAAERRKALASLAVAFPDRDEAWRQATARNCFRHLGECAFEIAGHARIDREIDRYVDVSPGDLALIQACLGRGKGVIYVSGHVGNFELMARRIAAAGFDCATIAKATTDPRTTALVERFRASGRLKTIWRGDPGAAKAMLRQVRAGGILGLLIDQDTDVQGVFVDFFGRPAFTPRAAADLALHTGAAVVVSFIHRRPDGGHRVRVREVAPQRHGDGQRDCLALTQELTSAIEAEIRAVPHEWVWMHQRWKTKPRPPGAWLGEEPSAR